MASASAGLLVAVAVRSAVRWLGRGVLAAWGACLAASVLVPGPELTDRHRARPARRRGRVSVVVPMRDEVGNAAGCIAALRAQDDVDLELIVVDDGSTDATREIAAAALDGFAGGRLVHGADLPEGWVGKPWACHQGARAATGEWLVFVDADVRFAAGGLAALLDDADAHRAQVLSAVGRQILGSPWERVVNPVVFLFIASLTPLPLARRPGNRLVAVNGQLLAFRREAYEDLGGHAAVRDAVVEDLALGQAAKGRYGAGYRFVWARELFATRMYTSLAEIGEGWSKNLALGASAVGIPVPAVVAGAALGGVAPWLGVLAARRARWARPWAGAALCQAAALGIFTRRFSGESVAWGASAPLGTAAVLGLTLASWRRTRSGSLRWRGRVYRARR